MIKKIKKIKKIQKEKSKKKEGLGFGFMNHLHYTSGT